MEDLAAGWPSALEGRSSREAAGRSIRPSSATLGRVSKTFVGIALTTEDIDYHDAARAQKTVYGIMAPFHIDACGHEGRRGEACTCPAWRFDYGGTILAMIEGVYADSLGEWYSRWECTDFDQIVRSDFERINPAGLGPLWMLAVVQIHFF